MYLLRAELHGIGPFDHLELSLADEQEQPRRKRPKMDDLSGGSQTATLIGDGTLKERSRILDRVGRRSADEH